jgi:hypothetical protein
LYHARITHVYRVFESGGDASLSSFTGNDKKEEKHFHSLAGEAGYERLCTKSLQIPPTAVGGLFKSFYMKVSQAH